MGLINFFRRKLGNLSAIEQSDQKAGVVLTPAPAQEPLPAPPSSLPAVVIPEPVKAPVVVETPPAKPRRMTKKRIRELHATDPGWDHPEERDKIRTVANEHRQALLDGYRIWSESISYQSGKRTKAIREAERIRQEEGWKAYAAIKRVVMKSLKRKYGADFLGFSESTVDSILYHSARSFYDAHLEDVRLQESRAREQQLRYERLSLIFREEMTPIEFELLCAGRLKAAGWQTETTRTTGDQGVDVIAVKDGVKVVFQVKKYASPVGNAAVQEIFAGKALYKGDHAAVISNAPFTPSAHQLAKATNVFLLHHDALATFTPIGAIGRVSRNETVSS